MVKKPFRWLRRTPDDMRRRPRKALSYILSVVIMTLITTSMAGVVLLWGLNEVGTSRDSFSSSIRSRMERAQERLVVEDVYFVNFVNGSNTLSVSVRNVGSIRIVADVVYVNHTLNLIPNKLSLGVRERATINITNPQPLLGADDLVIITVATTRGSSTTDYWRL